MVKLGYLLIRTIAKPVSGAIKDYAKDHPKFKEMCMSVAQRYHRSEVRLRRGLIQRKRLPSLTTTKTTEEDKGLLRMEPEIKPLDPAKAVETGANFIGETIVFLVAGVLLVADQLSSRAKEQARRDAIEARFIKLEDELKELKSIRGQITAVPITEVPHSNAEAINKQEQGK